MAPCSVSFTMKKHKAAIAVTKKFQLASTNSIIIKEIKYYVYIFVINKF